MVAKESPCGCSGKERCGRQARFRHEMSSSVSSLQAACAGSTASYSGVEREPSRERSGKQQRKEPDAAPPLGGHRPCPPADDDCSKRAAFKPLSMVTSSPVPPGMSITQRGTRKELVESMHLTRSLV